MSGISLGLSIFAVCLSLTLAITEWYRYHLPLQMVVREKNYKDTQNDSYLVFLWIAFVNPSSIGKTVFYTQADGLNGVTVVPCPYEIDRERDISVCQLPLSEKAYQIARNELLWLPLDIPPHQSTIKALPLLLTIPSSVNQNQKIYFKLKAYDVRVKKIAELDETIDLNAFQFYSPQNE